MSAAGAVTAAMRVARWLIGLDKRSPREKAADMRARADRLTMAAADMDRRSASLQSMAAVITVSDRNARFYDRRARRLVRKAARKRDQSRWWHVQADRLEPSTPIAAG